MRETQNLTSFSYICTQIYDEMATILLSIGVIALCIILLGVKVLFVKNGKFPSGHIHDNPAMRKHNIECARHEEMKNLN